MKKEIDVKLIQVVPFIMVLLAVFVEFEPFKLADSCGISTLESSLLCSLTNIFDSITL